MESTDEVKNFVQLYTAYHVRLRALALSLFPKLDDAEDLLQETCVVLWERFEQFSAGTNFFAWAATVMRYKAMELRRKRARLVIQFSDEALERIAGEATSLSDLMAERERALHDCISKLSKSHLNLLELRYQRGSSIKSVAEALGRTPGSVRQGLARIRNFLSECVARRISTEGPA